MSKLEPRAEAPELRHGGEVGAGRGGAPQVRAGAAAGRRQARPRGEAAVIAGEDGQLRRTVRAGVVEEARRHREG